MVGVTEALLGAEDMVAAAITTTGHFTPEYHFPDKMRQCVCKQKSDQPRA